LNFVNGEILSGANDRKLNILDLELKVKKTYDFDGKVRAADKVGDKVVVGLSNATILVITGDTKTPVMKGHHDGEIWGLDICDDTVYTSCDDNKLMTWSISNKKNLGTYTLNEKAGEKIKYGASSITNLPDNQCSRAVAYCPALKHIAVATNNGELHVHSAEDPSKILCVKKDTERWIEKIAYSPDGKWLAFGTHENSVIIYETNASGQYTVKGKCTGMSSYIMALDWTDDSAFIRTNSGAYEYLFYKIPDCKQDPSKL
jgi:WD40 repeat protein